MYHLFWKHDLSHMGKSRTKEGCWKIADKEINRLRNQYLGAIFSRREYVVMKEVK